MKKTIFTLALSLLSLVAFSHEGHNVTPGSLKSLHGGTVQAGKQLNLEVIVNGSEITLYPTSHEAKDIPTKDVRIEAVAKPRKGKPYPVYFITDKGGGLTATIELKGANRIPVTVKTTYHEKSDSFIVQVEE